MANTRDVMGEQACLDALIAGTLTELEDDGVYELRGDALNGYNSLTSISLPNCRIVGSSSLAATNLTTVSLPKCEVVGIMAFETSSMITSITLPECKTIKTSAFRDCSRLATVTLPSCHTLEDAAFQNCNALTSLVLGYEGVVSKQTSTLPSKFDTGGTGTVYVPASQLAAYQASSKWSGVNIAAIEG